MNEKRRFNRWYINGVQKATIASEETREEMYILDIGAGGISVSSQRPIPLGAPVQGEFEILPHGGPFFIKGQVVRITEKADHWKIVVAFNKIRTTPLEVLCPV